MYTVALVEDEYWAMIAIANTFQWEKYGFRLLLKQTDPKMALAEILEKKPDVVIADVQMPDMTGLELMTIIREADFPCELVVLSGYSDFEYARTGISLGIFDYCVKPLDEKLAEKLLQRLKNHLDKKEHAEKSECGELQLPEQLISIKNTQFQRMIDYINTNFEQQMHITKLSKQFFLNTSYCCKLFGQVYGSNFGSYVTDVRMVNAKKFLAEGKSVKETAQLVGYTDYFYFTKAFKKYYGCTPTEFRKEALETHLHFIIKGGENV